MAGGRTISSSRRAPILIVAGILVLSLNVVRAAQLGNWVLCQTNSQCLNGCCSKQYSDDGKFKCTPGGTASQCTGSLLGDWAFCTANSQCANSCCSKQYSGDGRYKCTPGGTKSQCTGSATTTKKTTTTAKKTTTTAKKTTTTKSSTPAATSSASDVLVTVSKVQGTYWSTQTDGGGCQMPEGSYAVIDALALGQGTALGALVYKPGLCGQVLRVNCGGKAVDAVVASTCNLGSTTCGVDLISRTWSTATGGMAPGVSSCTVSLTKKNPLPGSSPICYYRPSSETNNAYYVILGVLNTSGKLVASATAAGIAGTHSNGGWYEFNGNGQGVFTASASIVFKYEDGSSSKFTLSSCVKPSGVHIFS